MLFSGILKIGESIGVRLGDHGGSTSNRGFTSGISRDSHLNQKNLAGGGTIEPLPRPLAAEQPGSVGQYKVEKVLAAGGRGRLGIHKRTRIHKYYLGGFILQQEELSRFWGNRDADLTCDSRATRPGWVIERRESIG